MIATKGKSRDQSHPYFWAGFIESGDWRSLGDK
jgi:CHAT domain-containing protein